MEKKFNNFINIVDFGEYRNVNFIFLENKDELLKIDQFMNSGDFTEALLSIGRINENIFTELALEHYQLTSLDTRRGHQSTITFLLTYLSRNDIKGEITIDIEIKSRLIALIRNPHAHGKSHPYDYAEIYICYKYLHEILEWYLEKRGWILEPLPKFLEPGQTNDLNLANDLPDLIFDKSHNDVLPIDHEMKHDLVILDYLIKQYSIDKISNIHFPDQNTNISFAILSGIYGIDRRWKKLFKTAMDKNELETIYDKLDDKKHKIIKRAGKSAVKKFK
jgi:hypothetical protein